MHECGMAFNLSVSSFVSFINVLEFSVYKSLPSLVKFVPKHFILAIAIVIGNVFIISFSEHPLFVYRVTTDFCMLILYPASLLNVFISPNSFLLNV